MAQLLDLPCTTVAQPQGSRAQVLFDEAQALMQQGSYELACYKLTESQQLDPQLGTLLHLGHCLESSGRLVDAYQAFETALRLARRRNQLGQHEPREAVADKRLAGLRGRLCLITLKLDDAAQPDLQLEMDGQPLEARQWARPLVMTAGHHLFRARGRFAKTWELPLEIAAEQRSLELQVPKLVQAPDERRLDVEAVPEAPAPRPTPFVQAEPHQDARSNGSPLQSTGYVVAGLGVVGLVTGAVLGVMKNTKVSKMREICSNLDACDQSHHSQVSDLHADATALARAANWSYGIGGTLLATAAGLLLAEGISATDEQSTAARGAQATAF